jgi:hypothetical protein
MAQPLASDRVTAADSQQQALANTFQLIDLSVYRIFPSSYLQGIILTLRCGLSWATVTLPRVNLSFENINDSRESELPNYSSTSLHKIKWASY